MSLAAFQGKTVLITGGASGIGQGPAEELGRCGALVVIADRQLELAEKRAADIRLAGGKARAEALDVRDASAFADLAIRIRAETGSITASTVEATRQCSGMVSNCRPLPG